MTEIAEELLGQLDAYSLNRHHSFSTTQQMARESATVVRLLLDRLSDYDRLKARNAELEVALEPFSLEADQWADSVPDDHRSLCTEPGSDVALEGSETVFTIGDLRRARALLSSFPLPAAPAKEEEPNG